VLVCDVSDVVYFETVQSTLVSTPMLVASRSLAAQLGRAFVTLVSRPFGENGQFAASEPMRRQYRMGLNLRRQPVACRKPRNGQPSLGEFDCVTGRSA
jgi:hypothetical protein